MVEAGLTLIEIDLRPDDVSGFRKLAVGRTDAVYSNRDRGRDVLAKNGLIDRVRYAGADKGILYFAAIRRSHPDPVVSQRFFAGLRAVFETGAAERIIRDYGLEPPPADPS